MTAMFAAVAQHGDHVYARAVLFSIALHVDCTLGSDSVGDGSVDRPCSSLRMARDALRGLKPPSMPADVFVISDCFPCSKHGAVDFSRPLLELSAKDPGTSGTPISYRSYPGGAKARLLSGLPVPSYTWQHTVSSDTILSLNLTQVGDGESSTAT